MSIFILDILCCVLWGFNTVLYSIKGVAWWMVAISTLLTAVFSAKSVIDFYERY